MTGTIRLQNDSEDRQSTLNSDDENINNDFFKISTKYLTKSFGWLPEDFHFSNQIEQFPFLTWLVELLQPHRIIQVGANNPTSFYSYCYAVKKLFLDCHCSIIDLLDGEQETKSKSFVFIDILPLSIRKEFKYFSTLHHGISTEVSNTFSSESVDLLHFTGVLSTENLRRTIAMWNEKLSNKSIIVIDNIDFIDIGLPMSNLWEELKSSYPSFTLLHPHGILALATGKNLPPILKEFFSDIKNPQLATHFRALFTEKSSKIAKQLSENRLSPNHLHDAIHELNSLKSSLSWRLTKPLREINNRVHQFGKFSLQTYKTTKENLQAKKKI